MGKTATKVREEDAAEYIAGYALANDVSLPEESFYRPAIKAKCRDGFYPIGETVALSNVDNLTIYTGDQRASCRSLEYRRDLQRNAAQLLSALSEFATLNPGDAILLRHATGARGNTARRSRSCSRRRFPAAGKSGSGRT
ncbi:fumarylacetoacetate hydrolase family protein [Escherichia coli]|nr:fumarylacetoacetate hydrolase family protein [Escherichia coli]